MEAMTQAPIVCAGCGAALAADQRYCLHCGAAQGDPRVAYRELIDPARAAANGAAANGTAPHATSPIANGTASHLAAGAAANGAAAQHPAAQLAPQRDWTPVIALGGLGTLALVLVVGVLIGKSGNSSQPAAAAPQVITIAGGAAAPATAATADTTVAEDWPSGTTGFTVELGTLSKDGTTSAQVEAAKTAAAAKGADDVGVLDSDAHGSLPGGSYVIYSGVFDKKAGAKKVLAKLKGDAYSDAKVIAVNDGDGASSGSDADSVDTKAGAQAVQDLNNATGDDYQKKSSKLPDTVALPGKPPAKDNKQPGGGSGAETIG